MHFKKSVLKNHLLYSIITLMAIAMLFPITAFAQAYVQTWDLVDSGKHLDYDGNSTYMSYINTGAATWNAYKSGVIRKDSAFCCRRCIRKRCQCFEWMGRHDIF